MKAMNRGLLLLSLSLPFAAEAMVPVKAHTFDFNVRTDKSISWNKEQKVLDALDLIRQVIASPEFRKKVLNHGYQGRKRFQYNMGMTNQQIYYKILEGAEKLTPYKNNQMDLKLEFYSDYESNVVGYTLPQTTKVWINNKYFFKNSTAKVAGNLMHEWLHKLGFHHDREKSTHRKYSVPYGVGTIVKDLAKRLE
jgi:hypothetical protein